MAEYIDRETMLKYIEENNTADEWIVGQYNADWIYSFIESQPTADVVEVKHGCWNDNIQKVTSPAGVTKDYLVGYKCSVCGRTESRKEPYCNCGAKMDGGRADGR